MHSKTDATWHCHKKNRRYISLLVSSHGTKQDAISIWEAFEHTVRIVVSMCADTD